MSTTREHTAGMRVHGRIRRRSASRRSSTTGGTAPARSPERTAAPDVELCDDDRERDDDLTPGALHLARPWSSSTSVQALVRTALLG